MAMAISKGSIGGVPGHWDSVANSIVIVFDLTAVPYIEEASARCGTRRLVAFRRNRKSSCETDYC